MPGEHRDLYVSTTLFIVVFTTVVCGGLTEPMLSRMGMRLASSATVSAGGESHQSAALRHTSPGGESGGRRMAFMSVAMHDDLGDTPDLGLQSAGGDVSEVDHAQAASSRFDHEVVPRFCRAPYSH